MHFDGMGRTGLGDESRAENVFLTGVLFKEVERH
jgi:hypothetical protein